MGFYEKFEDLCFKKKVSKTVALEEAGVNKSAVTRWKNGELPNTNSLIKLCNYFGVTRDDLLTGNPVPTNATLLLSDTEAALLTAWRNATIDDKKVVACVFEKYGFNYDAPTVGSKKAI